MRGSCLLRVLCVLSLATPLWAQGPVIDHSAVACIVAEEFPQLEARFGEPDAISRARVRFRGEGGPWYFVDMKRSGPVFTGILPKPKNSLKRVSYYIEATDRQFRENRTQEFAASVVPQRGVCADMKTLAGVASSTASLIVGAPAGGAVVPVGFSSSGVVGASAATAAGAAGGAGVGGGIGTAAVVGIVAGGAAIAGVAVTAGGGSNDAAATTTTTLAPAPPPAPPPTTLVACPACYAGNWRATVTQTAVGNPQLCSSSNVVGRVLTLFFAFAPDGTVVFPPGASQSFSGRVDSAGNVTIVLPADTAPGLTCPEGGGTGRCTTTTSCTGTVSQSGNVFTFVFDRL